MITYELAKQIKDAGFPMKTRLLDVAPEGTYENWSLIEIPDMSNLPTLSELIEACGDGFSGLVLIPKKLVIHHRGKRWRIQFRSEHYSTPEEAVANLYLELNKKS